MFRFIALSKKLGLILMLVAFPVIVMAEVTKESDTFDIIINCGDEDIHIVGTVDFQITSVEGGDTYTFMWKAWSRGEGYGLTSGDSYILREKWMDFVQEVEPPFVFVLNDHGRLIGRGVAPNYFYRSQIRFVVNATGEVVLDTGNYASNCGP